jgi:hypothetical protein
MDKRICFPLARDRICALGAEYSVVYAYSSGDGTRFSGKVLLRPHQILNSAPLAMSIASPTSAFYLLPPSISDYLVMVPGI